MKRLTPLLWLLLVSPPLAAQEKAELELRGRLQTAFEARTWQEREAELGSDREAGWTSRFRLQRARLEARYRPCAWARLVLELEGAGQIEFGDRYTTDGGEPRQRVREQFSLQLRDAYGHFGLFPFLEFRAGQFKKPFSRLRLTSPWDLLLPERGLLDELAVDSTRQGGFGGRDVGAMIEGRWKQLARLRYRLGVFSGPRFSEGLERSNYDFVGRLELRPFSGARLAVDASHKLYHYKEGPVLEGLAPTRGHRYTGNLFGADARLKIGRLTLYLEGAYGDNLDFGPGHRLWGAHAIGAYVVKLGEMSLTPALMVEVFDPSDRAGQQKLIRLAAAVNVDPRPWLRLTLHGEWTRGAMWRWDEEAGAGFGGYGYGEIPSRVLLQLGLKL